MGLAVAVRVPKDREARFPDRCCGCLAPRPGDLLRIKRRRRAWFDLFSPWLMWSRRAVVCEVPICPSCRMQADRYRLLARLSFVATVIAVFLLAPYFIPDDAGRQRRRLITLGVILVATVPLIVVMVAFPPIVDLTVDRKGVAYEFRRRDYAELFCATNDGARIDD